MTKKNRAASFLQANCSIELATERSMSKPTVFGGSLAVSLWIRLQLYVGLSSTLNVNPYLSVSCVDLEEHAACNTPFILEPNLKSNPCGRATNVNANEMRIRVRVRVVLSRWRFF